MQFRRVQSLNKRKLSMKQSMLMLEVGDINAHFYYKSELSDILCYKTLYLLMISHAKLQLILLLLFLSFHSFSVLCYQTQNHHFNYLINLCYVNYECLAFYLITKQLHKVPNFKMWELVKSQLISMMEVQDINVQNLLLILKFLSFSTTFPMQLQQKETVENRQMLIIVVFPLNAHILFQML